MTDPIRSLKLYGAFTAYTLVCATIAGASAIAGDRAGKVGWPASQIWAKGVTNAAGVTDFVTEGLERCYDGNPYLLMSNHESHLDPPSIIRASERPVVFLAKEELKWIPLFGWGMERMGHIFIDRRNEKRARQSIEKAARRVQEGRCVLVFPEGTRTQDGELRPFKKGGFVLAVKAHVPIIPIGIAGTRQIWPSQSILIKKAGPVAIVAGEPIDTRPYSLENKEELMEKVRDAISDLRVRAQTIVAERRGG